MRKLLPILFLFILGMATSGRSQTILFYDSFNNYDSTSGPNYNGWQLTYVGPFSYYTSTQSSGPSGPNSYKFGADSATAISPTFANADSITYFTKGNGTDSLSTMYVYTTTDGTTWNLLDSYIFPNPQSNIPGVFKRYALPVGTIQIKFFYDKSIGNMAFDDFSVIKNSSSIPSIDKYRMFSLFPNPSKGLVQLTFADMPLREPIIRVYNMVGGLVKDAVAEKVAAGKYSLNLSNKDNGFYFIKVETERGVFTQRLTIN